MTLNSMMASFQLLIDFAWGVLTKPIILNTYSLWNVFQGVFGVWAFKIIIVNGFLKYRGWSGHGEISKGRRGERNTVVVYKNDN